MGEGWKRHPFAQGSLCRAGQKIQRIARPRAGNGGQVQGQGLPVRGHPTTYTFHLIPYPFSLLPYLLFPIP